MFLWNYRESRNGDTCRFLWWDGKAITEVGTKTISKHPCAFCRFCKKMLLWGLYIQVQNEIERRQMWNLSPLKHDNAAMTSVKMSITACTVVRRVVPPFPFMRLRKTRCSAGLLIICEVLKYFRFKMQSCYGKKRGLWNWI